ncbi:potassium-transporting ATPase subunit KdpC [Paracoccus sp. (in: a-proteobacteria)]|uniref:potassium-transporting ATPase subunit KdpC n=1 Tax=Paracoccus sp. TaxID=267 RepID=UPI0027296526|nr:potassium-transporting ATPase subunit KdpC [Paracoccus sp. (in: a-proteobacteria)]
MNDHIRPALASLGLMILLTGLAYPLAVTGAGQALFPEEAHASLIRQGDRIIGSALVGQAFAAPHHLHPRPSAVDYDAAAAGASNLGPTSAALLAEQAARAEAFRAATGAARVPVDAVTASGSGLDPHISPQNAAAQAARIAAARGAPEAEVRRLIAAHVEPRWLGLFGEPRVNVLRVNLALDAAFPLAPTAPANEG